MKKNAQRASDAARRALKASGRRRATKPEKLERLITVLQLLKRRVDKPLIVRYLMQKYSIRKSMAYRYYNEAVNYGFKQLSTEELNALFVEHVFSIRSCIEEARRDKQYNAVAGLSAQLSDLLGFKGEEGPPISVNVNQVTNAQQATMLESQPNGNVALELSEMTGEQLAQRVQHLLGGPSNRTETVDHGDRSRQEKTVVSTQSPS